MPKSEGCVAEDLSERRQLGPEEDAKGALGAAGGGGAKRWSGVNAIDKSPSDGEGRGRDGNDDEDRDREMDGCGGRKEP